MQLSTVVHGNLPYQLQDINGAELFAFWFCIRHVVLPVRVYTDSAFVYEGVMERGRIGTTSAGSAWAELWVQ
eukprot:9298235-Lingulodinium_polyedra.AAC.1